MEYLIRAFADRGYRVYVLSPKYGYAGEPPAGATLLRFRCPGIRSLMLDVHFTSKVRPLFFGGMMTAAKDLVKLLVGTLLVARAIGRTGASLVYVNEYVVIQGSLAAVLRRVPSVIHIRSLFRGGAHGIRRRLLSFLIVSCNRKVFPISRLEAGQIRVPERARGKITVVGEFVDRQPESPPGRETMRRDLGVTHGGVLVAMLGGISPLKGTLDFLRSAEQVAASRADVVFVLAGGEEEAPDGSDAGYHRDCRRLVTALQSAGSLKILGILERADGLLSACDVLVSPSSLTHFSRPVIEAWSFGKPVVASSVDHMRDLISDGRDGLLYPPGDCGRLSEAILSLAGDPGMRLRMGEAGRKKARETFDAARNTGIIVGLCSTLLPGAGSR